MSGTVRTALAAAARELSAAGLPSPRLDARVLLAHAAGLEDHGPITRPDDRLDDEASARLSALVSRRVAGEPVSRLVGRREFWSLEFELGVGVFDPRADSETVVELALSHVPDRSASVRVLDLGTGTGALLIAILSELPRARGLGIDVSPAALVLARRNIRRNGLTDRARVRRGDWGRRIGGRFGLIVSNPPYLRDGELAALAPEVALHDPREALAGGEDGLDCYRRLMPMLARLLAPGGAAVLELGVGQEAAVVAIARGQGLVESGVRRDLGGVVRAVALYRPHPAFEAGIRASADDP